MTKPIMDNILTRLEKIVKAHPHRAAFKLSEPTISSDTSLPSSWKDITYAQFWMDLQSFAGFWTVKLVAEDVWSGSVVAVWITGTDYIDYITFYGLQLAGFTPLVIRSALTDVGAVQEIAEAAEAKAIITDSASPVHKFPFPRFELVPLNQIPSATQPIPASFTDPEQVLFISLSSGSTSRLPKLIRYTTNWIHHAFDKVEGMYPHLPSFDTTHDVFVPASPVSHFAGWWVSFSAIKKGGTFVFPSRLDYSIEEMYQMIQQCGLNRLGRFPPYLTAAFGELKNNPSKERLEMLRGVRQLYYSGMALDGELTRWALDQGLPLMSIFASSELGFSLISHSATPSGEPEFKTDLLFPGLKYEFRPPMSPSNCDDEKKDQTRLLELVALPSSVDIPHGTLRSSDECFHTGDMFEESSEGSGIYYSRGRLDDWIKMKYAGRCDTKSIEDNVRKTCGEDLVDQVAVVGSGRIFPALLIEPKDNVGMDDGELSRLVIERIKDFQSRRYTHEKITRAELVIVVGRGTLPRSGKGNVRRRAAEEQFKGVLDAAYTSLSL